MTTPTTPTTLDPDGLLPVTNLPYGSITAQAEYLTTQHPGELTVAEFHALPERYYEKIVRSRCVDNKTTNQKCYYCGKVIIQAVVGGDWIHRKTGVAACNGGDRRDPTPPQATPAPPISHED